MEIEMETEVLVLEAEKTSEPHLKQKYRNPKVFFRDRKLTKLNPNSIRVEMIYLGLCGTDVHVLETDPVTNCIKSSVPLDIPSEGRVIGHEGIGKVVEIGSNVSWIKKGAYVTFESIIVCHYCDVCKKGNFNQCRNARLLGLEEDGLFGAVVDVNAHLAHDVSNLVKTEDDLIALSCIEPAGVSFIACKNASISAGDRVVIFGAGPIGLIAGIMCKTIFGTEDIYIVDPVPFRRKFAKRWIKNVMDIEEFFNDIPKHINAVIEASGHVNSINKLFRNLDANSKVVLLGRRGEPLAIEAVDHMITNEISIIGSRGHLGGAFTDILKIYENQQLKLGEVVTSIIKTKEDFNRFVDDRQTFLNKNCKILIHIKDLFKRR